MDEVEALTELKSRISADDWRTICNYVFKERELADQALASLAMMCWKKRRPTLEEDLAWTASIVDRLSPTTEGDV